MTDTFDWQPWARPDGEFVAFENIGDECVGKIVGIRTHDFGQGKGPVPVLDLERLETNEPATIVVSTVDLTAKVAEVGPQVGDLLAVKLVELRKIQGRPQAMKIFAVKHKVGERPEPTAAPDATFSEEPF